MMPLGHARWRRFPHQVTPWIRAARLHRPTDLGLLCLPLLWGAWLATAGQPAPAILAALLLATVLLRGAAWKVHDMAAMGGSLPMGTRLATLPPPARHLLLAEILGATLLLLWLGWPTLLTVLVAVMLAGTFLWLRQRTFLGELLLAGAVATTVIAAHTAHGTLPDKAGWLTALASALWGSAFLTQHAALHLHQHARIGVKSITMLCGAADRYLVLALQLAALTALGLAAHQGGMGVFMTLGLLVGATLMAYQQWLMAPGSNAGIRRAWHLNLWLGLAIFCGIAFHFLCRCAP